MLSKDFLVVSADLQIDELLRVVSKTRAKYLVINRNVGGEEFHYVVLIKALKEALKLFRFAPTDRMEAALNLHEHDRDRVIEVRGPPTDWILPAVDRVTDTGSTVLTDTGHVVGVVDPLANLAGAEYKLKGLNFTYRGGTPAPAGRIARAGPPQAGRRTKTAVRPEGHAREEGSREQAGPSGWTSRPPAPSPAPSPRRESRKPTRSVRGTAPPPAPFVQHERYPRASFPDKVALGRGETLEVVIEAVRSALTGTAFVLRAVPGEKTVPVLVVVEPGTFQVDGDTAQEILVPVDPESSKPANFRIIPRALGDQVIRVKFYPRGTYATELTVKTHVVRTLKEAKPASPVTVRASSRLPEPPPSADLTLIVQEKSRNGGLVYGAAIWSAALRINWETLGEISFPSDPDAMFRTFFSDLENIDLGASNAQALIEGAARNLYENVVPLDLRNRYWALRNRIGTIQVVSKEPWIPWEIMMPWDRSQSSKKGYFLCERHVFSRWLDGLEFPNKARLESVKVVAPASANLPGAQRELQWIRQFGRQKGFVVSEVSEFPQLMTSLEKERFDILHFSTHGSFDPAYPEASGLDLEGGIQLRPNNITGPAVGFGRANPLVILNACQTGELGFSFTRIGGWATSFLLAGACGFIGTQWSVSDQTAAVFTQALYEGLNEGKTLGLSVKDARLRARRRGDSSWLAYQLYAYPNAVSKLGNS